MQSFSLITCNQIIAYMLNHAMSNIIKIHSTVCALYTNKHPNIRIYYISIDWRGHKNNVTNTTCPYFLATI